MLAGSDTATAREHAAELLAGAARAPATAREPGESTGAATDTSSTAKRATPSRARPRRSRSTT